MKKNADIVEAVIKGLVKELQLTPEEVFLGIHNACVHGEIFKDAYYGKDDVYLKRLFKGIDTSLEAAKKMF